jgi:DNA-binding MarR family transcriptional regulator
MPISRTGASRRVRGNQSNSTRSTSDAVLREVLANTSASVSGAPPLPRVPSPLSRRFLQVCAAVVGEAFSGEEVAQLEFGALIYLEIEPGIDQRRLSEAMGIDPSKTSLTVDRLHAMGLIERCVNGTDRRARELYLTPKGKALWRRIYPKTKAANARLLAPLAPAESKLFLKLLVRIIEGNRSFAGPGTRKRISRTNQS